MPRQVDHDARRQRIADAVCELIAERGIEAATLRDVADRAGVSMGAVQRSFPKDGMLRFALEHIIARTTERARSRIDGSDHARDLLRITVHEMTLAESPAEARVWLTFVAQAGVRDEFAAVLREQHAKALELLEWLIAYGQHAGHIRAEIDPAPEARALQAMADGLTQHVVLGHTTPAEARALIDRATSGFWP
ncbi:TetR/AcrR family transcriptional regulator [Amycolatopsis anabasis]|uniref:TetR/AcrR family transcriptional regulator n=1 Tax=Amycolatopsis anabasis TaxID=1840409 RepID=UPI00131CC5CF|nr:TetR/AcrR family transcriptional regulator [Amycolatopsis anabasis]